MKIFLISVTNVTKEWPRSSPKHTVPLNINGLAPCSELCTAITRSYEPAQTAPLFQLSFLPRKSKTLRFSTLLDGCTALQNNSACLDSRTSRDHSRSNFKKCRFFPIENTRGLEPKQSLFGTRKHVASSLRNKMTSDFSRV